jgi:hypothetical protein
MKTEGLQLVNWQILEPSQAHLVLARVLLGLGVG